MISFRYHLVSTIAVFLGIVLGAVAGATALNGAVAGDLRRQVSDLKADNAKSADSIKFLVTQANNANVLARAYGPTLVASRLSGIGVVILTAPGAGDAMPAAVAAEVAAAGGHVTGTIALTKDLIDRSRASDVRTLVTTGVHPIGLTLPTTDDAGRLAGALLGYVLLGKGQATDLTQTVAGLTTLNMIKATGTPAAGKLVIVVAPGGVADSAAQQELASLVSQMGSAGPTVVVGDAVSAGTSGVINAIRATDTLKKSVSTVDDADGALGQLTMALAGAEAVAGKRGHYGTGAYADALLPGAAQ